MATNLCYRKEILRGVSWLAKRYYAEQFPKITTHYTIVPRETDPRWKDDHSAKYWSDF